MSATDPLSIGPKLVVPAACLQVKPAASAWFAANWDLCHVFDLPTPTTLRYALFNVGVASGNIQIAVMALAGSSSNPTFTRLMNSGIIACPSAGDQRLDLGATRLPAGRYALAFWCDNTTAQFVHGSGAATRTMRSVFQIGSAAGGVPATGTGTSGLTNRYMSSFALEGDVT